MKVELISSVFLIEYNLPSSTAGHGAKLFRVIFPDFKIVNKCQPGHTNTSHILTKEVAIQITSDLKEELLLSCWYKIAADGSRDKNDKFLPVLVRHVDKDSEMIARSMLDMPNTNNWSTAQEKENVWNDVREAFSLDCDNWVTFSCDNTHSMFGQRSDLQKISRVWGDKKIVDFGCPVI